MISNQSRPRANGLSPVSQSHVLLLATAISVFLAFAVWSSLTARPESDEGSFASPAYNLAYKGFLGTTVFEMEKSPLTRIDQRTYWVMPLFLLNAAAAFKILGFSLFKLRLVSVFWGLVLILSWYFTILKLSGNQLQSAFCALMLASSYVLIVTASMGRGDTMCAALGFAAVAVYLHLREQNLLLAILLSQCLVVFSGLTHFLGILPFFGLIFITLYFDSHKLSWRHIVVAALPYAIAGGAFSWWISRDFQAFKDQFLNNAVASGRTEGLSSPLSGFIREFTVRYPRAFGLREHSAGHSGPIYLKSLILVGYALGVFGVLLNGNLRRTYRAVLILMAIYFGFIALIDGQKLAVYLIHITPFYSVLLGLWLYSIWESRRVPRIFPVLIAAFLVLLQVGGVALRCKQNTYRNDYLQIVEYLNRTVGSNETVMGSQNLVFGLNPSIHLIADGQFGRLTGKRPRYVVYDPGVDDSWKNAKIYSPEFYEYLPRLLSEEYAVAFDNNASRVYVHR